MRKPVPQFPQASWVDKEGKLFVAQRPKRTLRRGGRFTAEIRDSFLDLSQQALPLYAVEDPTPPKRQYVTGTPHSPAITITTAGPNVHYHWRARAATVDTQKSKQDGELPSPRKEYPARRSLGSVFAGLEADIPSKEPPDHERPAVEATRPRSKSLKFLNKLFHRRGKAVAEDKDSEKAQQEQSSVSIYEPKKLHKERIVKNKSSFWRGIDLEEDEE